MFALLMELLFGWLHRRRLRLPPLSPEQRWAIAAGANLARLNGTTLASLNTAQLPGTDRHILRRWWSVTDGASLRKTMTWLAEEGHRSQFQELHTVCQEAQGDPVAQLNLRSAGPTVDFVLRHIGRFKNGDLVAWDFARLINMARWGFTAGYLPEAEAWEAIMLAARRLAREYASWEELSENYLLGFSYWRDGADPDDLLRDAATWLMTDPESPWRQIPWRAGPGSASGGPGRS